MSCDGAVIRAGAGEYPLGELAAQLKGRLPVCFDLLSNFVVIRGIDHDRHKLVVLGRAAQHGWPADVDVLNRFVQLYVGAGNRLFEWIKIHYHEVDRLDAVLLNRSDMRRIIANKQKPAMDLRMQSLDPPIEHFRKSCVN